MPPGVPEAARVRFDISLGMKAEAISAGAILAGRYGPAEHVAALEGNQKMLDTIAKLRARGATRAGGVAEARAAAAG